MPHLNDFDGYDTIHSGDLSPVTTEEAREALAAFDFLLLGNSPALMRLTTDIDAFGTAEDMRRVDRELLDLAMDAEHLRERQRSAAKFLGDVD